MDTITSLASALSIEPFQLFLPERLFEATEKDIYKADFENVTHNIIDEVAAKYFDSSSGSGSDSGSDNDNNSGSDNDNDSSSDNDNEKQE